MSAISDIPVLLLAHVAEQTVLGYTSENRFSHDVAHIPIELPHDKTNKMTCASSEDSDQPGHLLSLIRAFAVRSVGR